MNPTFIISAESRLTDIRALLDSYAVECWSEGLVYFRGPLHFCELRRPQVPPMLSEFTLPVIDTKIDVRLIAYEPPAENDFLEGIRERTTRWPFYVHEPLVICLTLGDQWWQYTFTPGNTYEDRRIEFDHPKNP